MLDKLNSLMGTAYTIDRPGLRALLENCLSRCDDFGLAYARLRRWWRITWWSVNEGPTPKVWDKGLLRMDFFDVEDDGRRREIDDKAMREDVIDQDLGIVVDASLPPRRVWDLRSNRVVERWMVASPLDCGDFEKRYLYAVSHSWMDASCRSEVLTPINGY